MKQSIVKVDRVEEGRRPELCRETGAVEEGAGANGKIVIVDFSGTVL